LDKRILALSDSTATVVLVTKLVVKETKNKQVLKFTLIP
jgi:hypothetical protein